MAIIMVYKHTSQSLRELDEWKKRKKHHDHCYNFERMLDKNIPKDIPIFIIDANNDLDRIEGIGIIYNTKIKKMYRYNIYSIQRYNRFSYKTPYYTGVDDIKTTEKGVMCIKFLEYVLFYGHRHLKRMENRFEYLNSNLILYAHALLNNKTSPSSKCVYCGGLKSHVCDKMKKNVKVLSYLERYFEYLLYRGKCKKKALKKGH
jgi:hypothetical protein